MRASKKGVQSCLLYMPQPSSRAWGLQPERSAPGGGGGHASHGA